MFSGFFAHIAKLLYQKHNARNERQRKWCGKEQPRRPDVEDAQCNQIRGSQGKTAEMKPVYLHTYHHAYTT